MYALINTMSAFGSNPGREMSRHRTLRAAILAQRKCARQMRAANPGGNSYLPTKILEVLTKQTGVVCTDGVLYEGYRGCAEEIAYAERDMA